MVIVESHDLQSGGLALRRSRHLHLLPDFCWPLWNSRSLSIIGSMSLLIDTQYNGFIPSPLYAFALDVIVALYVEAIDQVCCSWIA